MTRSSWLALFTGPYRTSGLSAAGPGALGLFGHRVDEVAVDPRPAITLVAAVSPGRR